MNEPRQWFYPWLERHQAANQHPAWKSFESAGVAITYLGWIKAFSDLGVTELEADRASLKLQRLGGVWPIDQLQKLLEILSPIVSSRIADQANARRRSVRRQWDIDQEAQQLARQEFRRLPTAEVARRLASIRERYRSIAAHPWIVEGFAVDEWRGVPMVPDLPAGETPVLATPDPESARTLRPRLTPGQREFLAALTHDQRRVFRSMTSPRRRQFLEPHSQGFDRGMLAVQTFELNPDLHLAATH